ncbi:MAG: hypothetical protein CMK59_04420 [Proteobacteria bacterium]|nr:hypothetical protein [Pseudomonadota bacterium]
MLFSRRNILSSLILTGCGSSLKNFPFDPPVSQIPQNALEIFFHSVCCFRIQWKETALLSDPFFTHLSIPELYLKPVAPQISATISHQKSFNAVKAIVVGHSHHDHVLDLPAISTHLHQEAIILGSETLKNMYANANLDQNIISVNNKAAHSTNKGDWTYTKDRSLRVLPIRSEHPNQYLFFHIYQGHHTAPLKDPPKRLGEFLEGETYGYLIDFLENDSVQYRVYIQTTSTGFPTGNFPQIILEEHNIDVAILAMDCITKKIKGKPSIIDFLNPKMIFVCHYENFFRSKDVHPKEGLKVNLKKVKKYIEKQDLRYIIPSQESRYVFEH